MKIEEIGGMHEDRGGIYDIGGIHDREQGYTEERCK